MLHRLIPRPIRRLWSEAALWRWCLILAVASSGMIWIAAPPPLAKAAVSGKSIPQADKNAIVLR